MNAKWHAQHQLPRRASVEQRIEWHREHQLQCGCRPIPPRLLQQMEASKSAPPEPAMAEAKFSNVVLAFADQPAVSYAGRGFGGTALELGGKIFAMLTPQGQFAVKLAKERVDELVARGLGEYFDPGQGRLMQEWFVAAPSSTRWLALAKEAHLAASGRRARGSRPPPRAGGAKPKARGSRKAR